MAPCMQLTRAACMGRRDSPSRTLNALRNALLRGVGALWMGSGEPDRRRLGGTAEQARLVLL